MNHAKHVIHWQVTATGHQGKGQPVSLETAEVWVERMNKQWGGVIHHWVEVSGKE